MTDTPIADDFAAIAAKERTLMEELKQRGIVRTVPPAEELSDWAVGDLEPVVRDLRSTIDILGHLITANSSSSNVVDDNAWRKVEDDLIRLGDRVERLWQVAWDQNNAAETEHEAELAAVKAACAEAKASPGSPADIKHAAELWRMLRSFVTVAAEECDAALGLEKRP